MVKQVHGGRKLHFGARRTWQAFNKAFPGHGVAFRQIQEAINQCPLCQKVRLGMDNYVLPVVRHLKKDHPRKAVGVDCLTVTPVDEEGNTCLIVIVEFLPSTYGLFQPRSTVRILPLLRCSSISAPLVCLMNCGQR